MEHLARELARLAWQLQRDVEDLRAWANEANHSPESDESIGQALVRIEDRLESVHGHTAELMDRVPNDLAQILSGLKSALLARLDELATVNQSVESAGACRFGVKNQASDSAQSAVLAARLLTPQERRVFQLCFQSGFLSYQDIATHLEVTPTAAKNLVNRIFLSDRKRPLFAKQYEHGMVRVGLRKDSHKDIFREESGIPSGGPTDPWRRNLSALASSTQDGLSQQLISGCGLKKDMRHVR